MSLRKLEASVPLEYRQTVLDALTNEGGIGRETHVGEFIVVREAENCVVISLVCTSTRAGELMNVLAARGVGVLYGTLTSLSVASQRPNPIALVSEFRELKKKIEDTAIEELGKDHQFRRRWQRRVDRLDENKIEYVTTSTSKSVEEIYNEIVDMSYDSPAFYVSVVCASVIAGVGLLTNSSVVVLSAMLISPLMGPILAAAFAFAIGDYGLFFSSVAAELRAACVTFAMGVVVALTFGPFVVSYGSLTIPTAEMDSRGQVSGLLGGVIIAIASGVVVATAITSDGINSLVGVAISASLLPPIVNSGALLVISLACGESNSMCTLSKQTMADRAAVSFALYAINFFIIVVVAACIFYAQQVGRFRVFLIGRQNTELLNVAHNHVRRKLGDATAMKGAVGEQTFEKILADAAAKDGKRDGDVENPRASDDDDGLVVPAVDYSPLRPFDEPAGVPRPSFATREDNRNFFGWIRDARFRVIG